MIGRTLGHYRIVEKLGEGGMGVVYRAEDEALGRPVALKILPEKFSGQQEALQRFLAEAKLASSINHPNIVSIYELGEEGGQRFIAMEYVAGKSLRALLKSQRLGLKKLLDLAVPAAEALSRAHRAGVIHRDIKPENLLVSDDGYIKVADFGLAKLKPTRNLDSAVTDAVLTEAGSVMGTAAYMAPEQLRSQEADARSDVFSFGVVLYEMATGESPFLRESAAHSTAAILRDTPKEVRALAPDTPAELERIIGKALEKEPEYRYQSMEELVSDLKRLRRDMDSGRVSGTVATAPTAPGAAKSWPRSVMIGGVVLVLAAAGWFGWTKFSGGKSAPVQYKVTQFTSLPGLEDSPTWSPDGRSLAYVSDAAGQLDIYVQQISGGRAIRLTDSDADDAQPAWSPDGSQIAFVSARARTDKRFASILNLGPLQLFFAGRNGDVWVMPALGGTSRRIAEDAYYPSWSPDGKQLVYSAMRDGKWGLWIGSVDGSTAPRLIIDRGQEVVTQPAWSPDGKWIAYCNASFARTRVFVVPSGGDAEGKAKAWTPEESNALMPSWSADGEWLYFTSDRGGAMNLWRARFGVTGLSDYEQVTSSVEANLQARPDPTGQRVAYSNVRVSLDLWEYDLASKKATQLTSETTQEDFGRLSPDGKWLAFFSNRGGSPGIWLRNLQDGSMTQVVAGELQGGGASVWSRDGKTLFFPAGNPPHLWRFDPATGNATKIIAAEGFGTFYCISPDERYGVISAAEQGIIKVDLISGARATLVKPPAGTQSVNPGCSPDGKWVAYYVQHGNLRSIWVVPLAGGAAQQITSGASEDAHPSFSPDSKLIYFLRNHQDIYVVPLTGGEPKPITNYRSFSILLDYPMVTADGKKIIFTRNDKGGDIFLLENPKD
ncbi:MAG TPA: protein kinase [Candidatus Nitrosotenuis sp.]|nr:protein kinase [Candidatus Nitrosotenuis sp.]